MDNLIKRLVTGAIIIAIIITSILLSKYAFILICLLINLLGLYEFYRLFNAAHNYPEKAAGFILSCTLFITSALFILEIFSSFILIINIPIAVSIFISELYLKDENPFNKLGITFLGVFYITVPFIFLISIPFFTFGDESYYPFILLKYFALIWIYDSSAYGTGKIFGKNPLFKRISPHKTWEGLIGGAIITIFAAYLITLLKIEDYNVNWFMIALIIILFSTFGDLVKSMLKRSRNVKDSGNILPGHGGILDRFDSIIGSAPIVFFYLVILTK